MVSENSIYFFFKKCLELRPIRKKNHQIGREIQRRKLMLESLEERALLSITCGNEDAQSVISAEICSYDFCPCCYSNFTSENSSDRTEENAGPITDKMASLKDLAPEVNIPANPPLATAPATVNVSDHFAEQSAISFKQFKTLITLAGNEGSVVFDKDITVEFTEGDTYFYISSSITFLNTDNYNVTFDGKNSQAFFLITNNAALTFENIIFVNGNGIYTNQSSECGGAFWNYNGTLNLNNCEFQNCSTPASGGALYNTGTIYITNSIIKNCSATGSNSFGGAITNFGSLYVIGSALYGNSAPLGNGGAIASPDNSEDIHIYIVNSTITGNIDASTSGGIYVCNGSISLYNSILALNYSNGSSNDFYNYMGTTVTNYSFYNSGSVGNNTSLTENNKLTVSNAESGIFIVAPQFDNGKTSAITNPDNVNLALQNSCSALIDKGMDLASIYNTLGLDAFLTVPTLDLANNARCVGNAIDIGAYENTGSLQQLPAPFVTMKRTLYNSIQLTWNSNDNVASYNVFYKKSSDSDFVLFDNVSDTSVTVNSLIGNTSYDFYVTALPINTSMFSSSDSSAVLTCSTLAEDPSWTSSYRPEISVSGPTVTISWSDSGADMIYLKYYYTNNEIDAGGTNNTITFYTSATVTLEVQDMTDCSYSVDLPYESIIFVKMWDSTLTENVMSYTEANVSIDGVNTSIDIDGSSVDVLKLSSKPDSKRIIYLDFTGHVTVGTYWNTNTSINKQEIISPVFSLDNSSAYSQNELEAIYQIWLSVSEDYSIFDVNVTTVFPGIENLLYDSDITDDTYGIRAAIGGACSLINLSCGGIAYTNSFGYDASRGSETPCFIFPASLAKETKSIAEATAHEVGHTLGLTHRSGGSKYNGEYTYGITSSNGIFTTNSNSHQDWETVMGAGYYSNLTQWSDGSYYNAILPNDSVLKNGLLCQYYIKDNDNYIPLETYQSMYFTENNSYNSISTNSVSYPDDLTILTNTVYYKTNTSSNTYSIYGGGYLDFRQDDYTATFNGGTINSGSYGLLSLDSNGVIDDSACQTTIGYSFENDQNITDVSGFTYNGIINSEEDKDIFVLTTNSYLNSISFTISGVTYGSRSYSNLPINAYLYKKDESSALVSVDTVYTTAMSLQGITVSYDQGIAAGTTLYLIIDGANVLINNDGYSSDYGSLGYYKISGSVQRGVPVTQNLTNLTSSFGADTLTDDGFQTTLTAKTGYSLPETLSITSGGTALTASQYSYSAETGILSVSAENILSDLVITAEAIVNNYTITSSFTNGTVSGPVSGTIISNDLTLNLTPNISYMLPAAVNVTIGTNSAVQGTDYTYDNATGSIILKSGRITGEVTVTAEAVLKTSLAFTEDPSSNVRSSTQIDLALTLNDSNASIAVSYSLSGTENSWSDISAISSETDIYYIITNANCSIYNLSRETTYYFKITAIADPSGIYYGSVSSEIGPVTTNKGTITGFTVSEYSAAYDGKEHGISITGLDDNYSITYSTSETGSFSNSALVYTNVTNGPQTVWYKISRTGYNDITGSSTVTVTKAQVSATFTGSGDSYTYSGVDQAGAITASAAGVNNETLVLSVAFTGIDGAAKGQSQFQNAGSYTLDATLVTVNENATGVSNYELQNTTSTAVIQKANLNVTGSDYNKAYDGSAHSISVSASGVNNESPVAAIYYSDTILNADNYQTKGSIQLTDNETCFTNFTNGAKTVYYYIVDNSDNYSGSAGSRSVNITKAQVSVTFTGTGDSYTYNRTDQGSSITASATGVNNETLVLFVAFTGISGAAKDQTLFKNAGNYNVTASPASIIGGQALISNYELLNSEIEAEIEKANLTVEVTDYLNIYDGQAHSVLVNVSGIADESLQSYVYFSNEELTRENFLDKGSQTLIAGQTSFTDFTDTDKTVFCYVTESQGNYKDAVHSGKISISKAQGSVTFSITESVYTYNRTDQSESITAFFTDINNELQRLSIDYLGASGNAVGETAFIKAGTYSLAASIADQTQALNYDLKNTTISLSIIPRTLDVTGPEIKKVYDETRAVVIADRSLSGIIGIDEVVIDSSANYETSSEMIDEYKIALQLTGADAGNYNAYQTVQIIPQTPIFKSNSYSVEARTSFLLASDGAEIKGADPNLIVYSWSFDHGETWIDGQNGSNSVWINTKSLDQSNYSMIMKVKYNGMESNISDSASLIIVNPPLDIIVNFCDYLEGHLLKLDISILSANSTTLQEFTVSWSEEDPQEDITNPGNAFTFNVVHYYENSGSYNLTLSLIQKVEEQTLQFNYNLGTHEIANTSKSEAANAVTDDLSDSVIPLDLSAAQESNSMEKINAAAKMEPFETKNLTSLLVSEESLNVPAQELPIFDEPISDFLTSDDVNDKTDIIDDFGSDIFNTNFESTEKNLSGLVSEFNSNKIKERSIFILSGKIEKDRQINSDRHKIFFDPSGIFSDQYFLDGLRFDF